MIGKRVDFDPSSQLSAMQYKIFSSSPISGHLLTNFSSSDILVSYHNITLIKDINHTVCQLH